MVEEWNFLTDESNKIDAVQIKCASPRKYAVTPLATIPSTNETAVVVTRDRFEDSSSLIQTRINSPKNPKGSPSIGKLDSLPLDNAYANCVFSPKKSKIGFSEASESTEGDKTSP